MQIWLSKAERQTQIVGAALRLARESSPALITTGDIAAAIGVTQGTVFKHFATKDAVWLAAMCRLRQTLLQRLLCRQFTPSTRTSTLNPQPSTLNITCTNLPTSTATSRNRSLRACRRCARARPRS